MNPITCIAQDSNWLLRHWKALNFNKLDGKIELGSSHGRLVEKSGPMKTQEEIEASKIAVIYIYKYRLPVIIWSYATEFSSLTELFSQRKIAENDEDAGISEGETINTLKFQCPFHLYEPHSLQIWTTKPTHSHRHNFERANKPKSNAKETRNRSRCTLLLAVLTQCKWVCFKNMQPVRKMPRMQIVERWWRYPEDDKNWNLIETWTWDPTEFKPKQIKRYGNGFKFTSEILK